MVRVGIAGIGFMGMIHYLAYQKVRGVKVVAFCETGREAAGRRLAHRSRATSVRRAQMMDLSGIAKLRQAAKTCWPTRRSTWSTSACRRPRMPRWP